MSWTFHGLPLHPVFVHAVVMLVPVVAIAAIVGSVWPAACREMGIATPILAIGAAGAAVFAMQAGEWLKAHVDGNRTPRDGHRGRRHGPPLIIFLVVAVVAQ